jgi:hypothetical protein
MATRKTFVEAKSQQRPEERWFVIGAPSKGILMLKMCWSLDRAVGLCRTVRGSAEVRAESASLEFSSVSKV